jgi:hypothetical protein
VSYIYVAAVAVEVGYFVGYLHASHRAYESCRDVAELDRVRGFLERFPF